MNMRLPEAHIVGDLPEAISLKKAHSPFKEVIGMT